MNMHSNLVDIQLIRFSLSFSGGSSSKAKDPEDEQDVETSFEFFDPSEGDFLGMKGLLNAYLDGTVYDCSGLVDHVIKQKTVRQRRRQRGDGTR